MTVTCLVHHGFFLSAMTCRVVTGRRHCDSGSVFVMTCGRRLTRRTVPCYINEVILSSYSPILEADLCNTALGEIGGRPFCDARQLRNDDDIIPN